MEKINLTVSVPMNLEYLANMIVDSVEVEDIPKLIALIDAKTEMWETTLINYKHFAALKDEYVKEVASDGSNDVDDLKPKKIKL